MEDTLLEVRDLQVEFSTKMGIVRVLDKVNLKVDPRQTVGIIGESGCGKSMMALSIMGLVPIPPGRIAGGEILYCGTDLLTLEKDAILEGLESGADDYLTKPFDTEILKTKIKGVLQNRKIMRQYFLSHSLNSIPATGQSEEKEDTECANLLSPMDKEFLERCTKLVTENLANPDFTINQLSRELALSRTIFYEKLKALTGQAPNEFIKLIRMTEAANLLKQQVPVQEVALLVGFTDSKYFSTVFKKHYGVSPSKFL